MVFEVIFSPTKTFRDAFDSSEINSALIVVLLSAVFSAFAVFLTAGLIIPAVLIFVFTIIQWLLFSAIIWFFEFVHVRKRKKLSGVEFGCFLSVVGKLWTINLAASAILLFVALVLPIAGNLLLAVLAPLVLILSIVFTLGWFFASFKLLKVVFGAERGKLVINWIIINFLNLLLLTFVSVVLGRIALLI